MEILMAFVTLQYEAFLGTLKTARAFKFSVVTGDTKSSHRHDPIMASFKIEHQF